MPTRAQQLLDLGQSVWLDFIRRGHLLSGEFDRDANRLRTPDFVVTESEDQGKPDGSRDQEDDDEKSSVR